MRLSGVALEEHVAQVIALIARLGAVLDAPEETWIHELPNGVSWYALEAILPEVDAAGASTLVVRERWHRVADDRFERAVAPCAYIEGSPVRDAFAGVMRLAKAGSTRSSRTARCSRASTAQVDCDDSMHV